MRFLLALVTASVVCSNPLPDHPPTTFGGFQPLHGARGTGPSSGYNAPAPGYIAPPPAPGYSAPPTAYNAPGPVPGPTKTIYVNVPHPEPAAPLPPIAAGPPRKHYKIVFIRAPAPPPPPQPILPPRTEQKTLIYVLHQRPQQQEQQVIEIPAVKHNPEVFFVQYDNPPTAEELQRLSAGDLNGFSLDAQPLSIGGGGGGGAGGGYNLGGGGSPLPSFETGRGATFASDLGPSANDFGSFGDGGSSGVSLPGLDGGAGSGGSSFISGGSGGVSLPGLGGGAPSGGFSGAGSTGVPLPTTFGGSGGGGVPLPGFGGSGSSSGFGGSSGGGVPLPGLSGSSIPGLAIRSGGGSSPGSGLQLIGDDVVRPIGNTGFFQEVDDDIAALSGFSNIDPISIEFDDAFDNRVGVAAPAVASRATAATS